MTVTTPATRLGPWSPLRARVFRALWIAGLVSNIGTTMHTVGASWAMTSLTTSPVTVSLVQTAWAVPGFLFAVPAGVFADVLDRRRLILITQVVAMFFALALGILQLSGHLDVPLLLLGTLLLSIALTMAGPPFMALIPDLVGPEELAQAIGLNNISFNGAQSVGPALAGVVIALSGPGAVFLVNAASFLGIVVVMWRYRPERPGPTSDEGLMEAMWTGIRYFSRTRVLKKFALRIMLAFFVTSSVIALLPIDARQRLHTTPSQFGMLATAVGVGAVLAVWVLARLRPYASADAIVFGAGMVWAAGAGLLALSDNLVVSIAGVLLAGAAAMATMNITYSMFMLMLPAWIRGRASSVVMLMVWLGASTGAVAWGALAARLGIGQAFAVAAAAQVVITAAITVFLRLGSPQMAVSAGSRHAPSDGSSVEP